MYVVVILIGFLLLAIGGVKLRKYHAMKAWPSVEGVLTALDFGRAVERIKYSSLEYVYPIAAYEYSVHGKHYRSDRIAPDRKNAWYLLEDAGSAPWQQWKKDEMITVYYNPRNPSESTLLPVLQAKRRSHLLALLLSGLLLATIGTALGRLSA